MRYQTYVLHLIDGTAIPMVEDYDMPAEKGDVYKRQVLLLTIWQPPFTRF